MSQNTFESFNEQVKKLYAPIVNLNKLLLRNTEKLTEQSLSTIKTYAELGINQLHEVSQVSDAQSLSSFSAKQAEWLNTVSKQLLEDAQRLTNLGNELRGEIEKVVGETLSQVSSASSATAPLFTSSPLFASSPFFTQPTPAAPAEASADKTEKTDKAAKSKQSA